VDRQELEEQLYQEFAALDMTKPETIDSIDALRRILKHDEGKGKRGILITLIHKFRPEELQELQKELENLSKSRETILTRRNVVAFIDEGHRTQYGILAAQMRLILRNASFFAFTGTPISKRGRDTYLEFSYPPEEKYQDKYFITDSIEDGFTVKISYQPRLEKDVHLEKELLEAFLEVEYEELPEEIREKVEERVKKKLNAIRVILENEGRIKKVAQDVAEHFKENIDGKFKAMVVAVNRRACVHYKRALDELLPKEYSEVVMTFERNDEKIIREYLDELTARYKGKDVDEIRKEIIEKFKEEEFPKILIVTDMLLTGFDAPVLQAMYLDKPLKEHRLLQAIARTNRPFKGVKEAGMILDYVGILKEFTKAFEAYSKEDIKGVLYNMEDLRNEFTKTINETLNLFQDVPRDKYDRETMLKAVEILTSKEENSKKFLENYKRLRKIFELLGPDEIKVRLFSEYKWISAIYTYYTILVFRSKPSVERYVQKYFLKTLKYVHESTELENLEKDLPIIEFDENYMKRLEEKVKSVEEKAANMVFTLNRFVLVEKHKNPIYESLVERVERILKLWKEKTKDFETIYREGLAVIEEINKLKERQKKLKFSDFEYSILLALERRFDGDKNLVKDVKELSDQLKQLIFSGWFLQQTAKKDVERTVRRFVRRYVQRHGIKLDELDELYQNIMEDIITYGQ
ncbi:MAG: HsdR family type I site-specific deoxyribonuclease, partial [Candidatus Jordarchaeaceae archaeon]